MHTRTQAPEAVLRTSGFNLWLEALPPKTRTQILGRLDLIAAGHFGDCKRFEGLLEFRWKSGIRVYGFFWKHRFVVALSGGNKNGQDQDIREAKSLRESILDGTHPLHQS